MVRPKCGAPGIFGYAAEQVVVLREVGVDWEIVPGFTDSLRPYPCGHRE